MQCDTILYHLIILHKITNLSNIRPWFFDSVFTETCPNPLAATQKIKRKNSLDFGNLSLTQEIWTLSTKMTDHSLERAENIQKEDK